MELKMKSGSDISMKPDADMVMRKLAQNPSFCGLQKLNSLNLHPFCPSQNPRRHFFLLFNTQVVDIKRLANSVTARAWRASRFPTPSPVWEDIASIVAWAWPKSMQTAKRRLQQDTTSSTHVIHSKRFMYPLEHQRTMTLTLGTPTKSWKRVCRAASR